ncbi:MAG: universal stress protein [Novosphingobium sp.]|nr:universal stress protein [Novosphingobium sp.]
MRSILVYADHGKSTPARLQSALALGRATGGHVTVLVDTPLSPYLSIDGFGSGFVATDMLREALERDDKFGVAIAEQLAREDVAFDVVRSDDETVDAMTTVGRLADVAVVSHGCRFAGELALRGACPVLVVPEAGLLTQPVDVACVAWDGGNEAARALREAVPLLALAGQVHVLTVTEAEKTGGFPPTDALRYLSRHGVKAELHEVARVASVEQSLAGAVALRGAQLLVMGAYGHRRLTEFLMGGVTRYFLDIVTPPALLLAH